ncbi:Cytochrome c/b562 domain-containing protein, partial [Dioscorea alata]
IRSELSKKAKFNYTENQVRNKFNQLRSHHTNFDKLLKETSVGYVAATGQLIASEEIWQRLYGVNKMAKKFRKYGCPLYDKLCVIYGDTTATGSNARPSTHSPSDSEENVRDPLLQEEDKIQTLSDEDDIFGDIPNTSQGHVRPNFASSTKHKGKKAKTSDALMTILNSYNENTKRKVEVWEKFLENSSISTTSNQDVTSEAISESKSSRRNFLKESLEALDALDGIDGAAYAKAIEKFHDDELWREIFLQLPNNRKKDWVLNLK